MRLDKGLMLMILFLGLAGFARPEAKAMIVDGKGNSIGAASFVQEGSNVKMSLDVKGLSAGEHGIHIHGAGKCEGPDFKSAGGHFNPSGKQHGLNNPKGHHLGDLPNLVADAQGNAKTEFILENVSLKEGEGNSLLQSPGGTAVVIHAGKDDEMSDPAGNSGGRIACGVIEKS